MCIHDTRLDARGEARRAVEEIKGGGVGAKGNDGVHPLTNTFSCTRACLSARDINLNVNRVVASKALCNKLWNAVGFALAKLDDAAQQGLLWAGAMLSCERVSESM